MESQLIDWTEPLRPGGGTRPAARWHANPAISLSLSLSPASVVNNNETIAALIISDSVDGANELAPI